MPARLAMLHSDQHHYSADDGDGGSYTGFGPGGFGLDPRPFHQYDEYGNSNSTSCIQADTLKMYTWGSGCCLVVLTLILNILGVEVVGKAAAVLTLLVLLPFLVTVRINL